jgi:hypothetical protein
MSFPEIWSADEPPTDGSAFAPALPEADSPTASVEPVVVDGPVVVEEAGEQPDFPASPAETPPFVDALDPPDAPPPPRPLFRVSRETEFGDPACSWKLAKPGTKIGSQSLPSGDANVEPIPIAFTPAKGTTRTIVFDGPAYFPIVRYKDRFKSLEDEGLRILEGMTLRFAKDGSYEVEFLADGVTVPAILRLQFHVSMGVEGERGSVTLPPLNLDPRKFPRNESNGAIWTVIHRGSAPWLMRAFMEKQNEGRWVKPILYVSRDGVARLGSGTASTNPLPR